tara:strand:+ start:1037 stop:2287 length:1251 start_codon:yes stop_codon:yes gene_type:complete
VSKMLYGADKEAVWSSKTLAVLDPSLPQRFQHNSHAAMFRALRREAPVHFCPDSPYGPYWSVTRHEDILAVERDHQVFSSENNIIIGDVSPEFDVTRAFATSDPPTHTQERRAVLPSFTRKRLQVLAVGMRQKIRSLLAGLPRDREFDWVEEIASPVTNSMVGELFDLAPEDRSRLPYWCEVLVTTPEPGALVQSWEERQAVVETFRDRLLHLWSDRREDTRRQDVIAALSHSPDTAQMNHNPMRLVGTVALIAGANEAARGALSGSIVAFHQTPGQWSLLEQDRGLIDNAVSEIVRWQSPIIHMRRTTTQETQIGDEVIPEGARVVMWYCSGNRDERVFEDAEDFNILRYNADKHLGYGSGIHRCLGQHVAEMELRLLLEELLDSQMRLELVEPPQRILSNFSANYSKLVVRTVA